MAHKLPPPPCPGGARKGSGRKSSQFVAQCQKLAGSPEFLKWAADVLAGKPVETKITMNGPIQVPATTSDRSSLWEKLAAYGYGRPVQQVAASVDVSSKIILVRASD